MPLLPINTRDAAACGAAYMSIPGWPIAPGRKHRPRGGCTYGEPDTCPGSGAHPRYGPLAPCPADGLTDELNAAPTPAPEVSTVFPHGAAAAVRGPRPPLDRRTMGQTVAVVLGNDPNPLMGEGGRELGMLLRGHLALVIPRVEDAFPVAPVAVVEAIGRARELPAVESEEDLISTIRYLQALAWALRELLSLLPPEEATR